MAEEEQCSKCKMFPVEANNQQSPPGTTATSISANDGSHYSAPCLETRRNDSEGQNQHHHSQQQGKFQKDSWVVNPHWRGSPPKKHAQTAQRHGTKPTAPYTKVPITTMRRWFSLKYSKFFYPLAWYKRAKTSDIGWLFTTSVIVPLKHISAAASRVYGSGSFQNKISFSFGIFVMIFQKLPTRPLLNRRLKVGSKPEIFHYPASGLGGRRGPNKMS
ncbi:hypothetical protein BKA61DRAFT_572883 [Leptodontidium sp. MPI-SDFR-AT-0119]|nr:hypothetical protein BKA61DRAFT_572883 [Leptodontidium sp. MPI-SDFR-AT-0119]